MHVATDFCLFLFHTSDTKLNTVSQRNSILGSDLFIAFFIHDFFLFLSSGTKL